MNTAGEPSEQHADDWDINARIQLPRLKKKSDIYPRASEGTVDVESNSPGNGKGFDHV